MPEDQSKITLYAAIRAARLGREVLLEYAGKLKHIEEKFQAGLVSEADKESERAIFDYLRKNFPEDEFLGEETSQDQTMPTSPKAKGGRWIVDPLDGTTNYIHGFPVFAVSIGYELNGELEIGVIDVPAMGEVYTAVRGQGAFMNGKELSVSKTEKLRDSFLATGFIGEHEDILQEQMKVFPQMVRSTRAVRRAGAAAYDLAMVARGVFDGYWERGLKPWDSAAGVLLVREAGGIVTTYRGEKYHPYKKTLIAGNPKIHDLVATDLRPHLAPESD